MVWATTGMVAVVMIKIAVAQPYARLGVTNFFKFTAGPFKLLNLTNFAASLLSTLQLLKTRYYQGGNFWNETILRGLRYRAALR
jgi:hypothetical protein